MKVWVTRAQPGADATAARLRVLGHVPLVVPALEVRPLANVSVDLAGVSALAFTSRNGVEAFARLSPERGLPVYAVGDTTAQAAREAGFEQVLSADGNVETLAARIAKEPPPPCGEGAGGGGAGFQSAHIELTPPPPTPPRRRREGSFILHPSAREPAGDLPGLLAKSGIEAISLAVYETVETPLTDTPSADAILVHSPKAACAIARLLAAADLSSTDALCISQAAAAPLRSLNFRRVNIARFPNEAALLKLLEN